MQPDATKRVIPVRQHRGYVPARMEPTASMVEKMPMLPLSPQQQQASKEYYMQISPSTNCDQHDYMQIGKFLNMTL